ncbi:transporter substrate-binding domain-containing protein [Motilimonas cestriensis]|uniref:diguanylate cyclase n=1 Tax=Motilimonas cestriensis TaxID=2742685 RepID=A0ABS8WD60_9GAMM|nr:transporter substrate-binding domain-containing protein [Motilimonas cestriensis]MCE2596986.1 transporter substrate-binding domain-containing protein [Motilimonas cestriensis]
MITFTKLYLQLTLLFFTCCVSKLSFGHEIDHSTVALSADEQVFIQNNPAITLASGDSFEPFTILNADGSVSGFDADLVNIISERTGLKIKLALGNWKEMQARTKRREFDGISTASPDEDRKTYLNFSKPYTKLYSVVLVQKGNPLNIRNIDDLENKRIALQKGNLAFERMVKATGMNISPVYVDSIHDMIKTLVSDQADFTVLDESYAYVAQLVGLEKLIEVGFVLGKKPFDLTFGLRNDKPELVSIINKGLASVTADEMLVLRNRWLGGFGSDRYGDQNTIPFSPKEVQFLKQQQRITVCVTPDGMPFESLTKGKHDGMSKDYLAILTSRLGLKTNIYPTRSWQETIQALGQRQCDVATLAMKPSQHNQGISYTSPIVTSPINIITQQANQTLSDLNSLANKKVAMVQDTLLGEFIRKHYPNIHIVDAVNSQQALESVNNKQTDAYIGSAIIARHIMLTQPNFNLKVVDVIPYDMELTVATRADLPELASLFQKTINLMDKKENQQIYNKWVTTQYKIKNHYQGVIKISLGLLAIIIAVLLWNYSLRKEKHKTALALEQVNQMNLLLAKKNDELALLANTDELTGLWNRKKINQTLKHEFLLAQRNQYDFGVILIDIDLFKSINDCHGHQIGDEILIEFAKQLRYLARESDLVARWGGEEFLLICPLTIETELFQIAERLRKKIAMLPFEHIQSLTVSMGVASHRNETDCRALLKRADQALYQAKHAGRNRAILG